MAGSILGLTDDQLISVPEGESLIEVLQIWANELIDDIISSIDKKQLNVTGSLRQGAIVLPIEDFRNQLKMNIQMAGHYAFVDKGVRGTEESSKAPNSPFSFKEMRPPSVSDLDKWANNRGLSISGFALQDIIFRTGIRETKFYSDVVTEDRFKDLKNRVAKASKTEIRFSIKNKINKINNGNK